MSNALCRSCGGHVDAQTGVCPQCATQVDLRNGSASVTAPASELGGTPTLILDSAGPEESEAPEISGYRVLGRLGEGGMGAVYLAEETTLGRRVALKVISTRVAPDAQSKVRFQREARTLATIEHPHVVRVYSFGEVDGKPYLAMEYVEGETLTDRIARLGSLSPDDALRITRDIVEALDAAWDKRVIHRDIKPSNILIDRRNRVHVADFGLAKPQDSEVSDHSLTASGLMVGTPHYISPEQAQGRDLDFRSDFYSLGIMLFHMLSGERPFRGSTPMAIVAKHLTEPMPSLRSRRANLPPELDRIIGWMTEKDPARRPSSHQQLLAAIDALFTRTPTAPMPSFSTVALGELPASRPQLRPALIMLAILFVLASAFVVYQSRRIEERPVPTAKRSEFVVAIAPFYGPDDDSAKEGRVMAALIEHAIVARLGKGNARVVGIEETKSAVRSHDAARELGQKLGASAVIWGEAFALRTETEIRPYVTIVATQQQPKNPAASDENTRLLSASRLQSFENAAETGGPPVKLEAEAPNQIELRKTSASGIGAVVMLLAGIHALDNEQNYDRALALFREAPRSAETLRYQVQALVRADRREEARAVLEEVVKLDPNDAPSHALLGDLHLAANRMTDAIAAYQRAAATGKPYTASRGIIHEGKFYARETYQQEFLNDGNETETLYLLAIDPTTQRVTARWSLPGMVTTLRSEGNTLVVAYEAGKNRSIPGELRLKDGRFDRELWSPSNLLWRMRSMRSGRVLAGNFLSEIDRVRKVGDAQARFALREDAAKDLPATLPDLERAVRAAAERDPTQPWHLFFLAITLREQKRTAEANAVFDELVQRDFPGVPYWQFSWMLASLERLRYHDWMDRLYPKALAVRRAVPQPVLFSTLIERLINASFVRHTAMNRDLARGYDSLLRAREIAGITPDGEDFAAAAWAAHFEAKGDAARAKRERDVMRSVHAHEFNYVGSLTKADYALTALAGTLLAFVALLIMIKTEALRRARSLPPPPKSDFLAWWLKRIKLFRAVLAGIGLSAGLLGSMWLLMSGQFVKFILIVAAIAAGLYAARRLRVSPRMVIASVSRRERIVLLTGYLLVLASMVALFDRFATRSALAEMPIGLSDALGHPTVVDHFEGRLNDGGGTPALHYAAAVVNHYAGNTDRAKTLYLAVAGNHPNASANRQALEEGRMPAVPPTAADLWSALAGTRIERWSKQFDQFAEFEIPVPIIVAVIVLPLILLSLFSVRAAEFPADEAPIALWLKFVMLFVPGLYDVRRGAPWRGLATLVLLMIPIVPVVTGVYTNLPVAGPLTAGEISHLAVSFPLPSDAPDPLEPLRWTFRMAYPYARIFWILIAICAVAGLALHLSRVRTILREPRSDVATGFSRSAG